MKETIMASTTLSVFVETLTGFSFVTDMLDVHPVIEATVFRSIRDHGTYMMTLTLPKKGVCGVRGYFSLFKADFTSDREIKLLLDVLRAAGCRDAPAVIARIVGWAEVATMPSAATATVAGERRDGDRNRSLGLV